MTSSKSCFKCEITKPLTEFYKHSMMADGHLNKCKACTKKDVANHREKNIETVRAYDRERAKRPERIQHAIEVTRQWRLADKRRLKAHNAVARALRKGLLTPTPCVICASLKSVAHHEDYDKPLDVVWMCQACHKQHHEKMKENN